MSHLLSYVVMLLNVFGSLQRVENGANNYDCHNCTSIWSQFASIPMHGTKNTIVHLRVRYSRALHKRVESSKERKAVLACCLSTQWRAVTVNQLGFGACAVVAGAAQKEISWREKRVLFGLQIVVWEGEQGVASWGRALRALAKWNADLICRAACLALVALALVRTLSQHPLAPSARMSSFLTARVNTSSPSSTA